MNNVPTLTKGVMLDEYMAPLIHFLNDKTCTEICINRPQEIWIESINGWQCHSLPDLTYSNCHRLATLIANSNTKSLSQEKPILSAALPSGERVQVVIPPACEKDTISFTIRKPSTANLTLDDLDRAGAFNAVQTSDFSIQPFEKDLLKLKQENRIKDFLSLAVQTKQNIVVVGKTGSGKTTFAKSLTHCIPLNERIITIEDVHELQIPHKNCVHLFYSREGESGITAKQALISCLRMKPDRILLAELRGDEAWDYIKSINTGHPGSITTLHANGAIDAFEQLVSLVKDSSTGSTLDTNYIKHRLFTTIDIIIDYHQRKLRGIYYDPIHKHQQQLN